MEQSLRANLRLCDFYYLKPYLRKTKTKIRILSKKGFPFWCHRHPKLKWFLCLCICMMCVGIYSMNFVWNIEIIGNTKVNTQEIIEYLQERKVEVGQKKDSIDCSVLERLLREKFHDFGWVTVYLEKTNLCIEIKESLYDKSEHFGTEFGMQYNIVANKDAKISSIITRAGKAVVKEGQFVKKDDLLVLGQNEIFDDSGALKDTLHFNAQAQILGDVIYEINIPISEIQILALKIADKYSESMLLNMGYHKTNMFLEHLKANGVIILDIDGMIDNKEKNICFQARVYAREQIGINIPAEEVIENEFE